MKRLRSTKYLGFVRSHPCMICENNYGVHAHHLRKKKDNYPKAMGMKVSDEFTVPLCWSCHARLHQPNSSEDRFWDAEYTDDPYNYAEKLWKEFNE